MERWRRWRFVSIAAMVIVGIALLMLTYPVLGHADHSLAVSTSETNATTIAQNQEASGGGGSETQGLREVPTREEDGWRRLGENESVPKGSHVRLNMTSGEKWVKIKPEETESKDVNSTATSPVPSRGQRIVDLLANAPDEELQIRIEKIRTLGLPGSAEFETAAQELWEERQALLRGAYSDSELDKAAGLSIPRVTALCRDLKEPTNVTRDMLEELDELVEDLDEAQTFANAHHRGLEKCLNLIEHNDTSHEVKSLAAGVIGKAIKSTSDLQNVTISLGGFGKIFKAFKKGMIAELKALYSLGSLLRGSKEAAMEALNYPEFFADLVSRMPAHTVIKVRERTAALIGDLLNEPDQWCWKAFERAGLCHSSLDLTMTDREANRHVSYLYEARDQVCAAPKVKQEL